MTRKTLDELAAGHALGSLTPDEERQLAARLAHDTGAREEVAAFIDAAVAMGIAGSPVVTPQAELRARILAAVAGTPQERPPATELPVPEGFRFVFQSDPGWVEPGLPGFRTKLLSGGDATGCQVMLAELTSGGRLPEHDHTGSEELIVISGQVRTEGRVLGPGDYLRAEVGTHHHELVSENGCLALLIVGPAVAS